MIYHTISFPPPVVSSGTCGLELAHLSEAAAPRDDLRVNLLAGLLLMVHDGLEQTIQVLGDAVIVVDKGVEAA